MALKRMVINSREEWLAQRINGIGASEAAATVGMSPYMTELELWKLKTGQAEQKDISSNEAVSKGVRFEPILRDMYRAEHPDYHVDHFPYDILSQDERPWLFATLDGEISTIDGRDGILEIKTATPVGRKAWAAWNDRIPDHYYCQVTHQLLATGADFVDLYAALFDSNETIIRSYHIERESVKDDMAWLLAQEEAFWRLVQEVRVPGAKLTL